MDDAVAHAKEVEVESEYPSPPATTKSTATLVVIDRSDSDDGDDSTHRSTNSSATETARVQGSATAAAAAPPPPPLFQVLRKQFWKAGDYQGLPHCFDKDSRFTSAGMEHLRVHPKFLHSNATSHKWALGAFAELLDNALDEVCDGATRVEIDMVANKKYGKMLLIEDNGGGMDPEKMRQCMSLGYSAKSEMTDTIGQYGNGFKTSTMRLGADVIVFSCCRGQGVKRPTRSIGLLSYTFLKSTGKEDIVVPMLDYERGRGDWRKLMRSTSDDWNVNLNTIIQWSPFSSEKNLLHQFSLMTDHGTRIIIYNLWEDDQGILELDFDADEHERTWQDIQIRGVKRDEKNIRTAERYPNARHFLTYHHSLRSYASILYLRIPPGFRIILRGQDVVHHNIVNDMMMREEITYRPQPGAEGFCRNADMVAVVTIGFVKDAGSHIDVQGFNVYHKNRLIKPFWRIWNSSGSDGRGVIGVLEADFVEPAHDKQGFERTTVLAKLEARLMTMQKIYWRKHCHKIGYAPRQGIHVYHAEEGEASQLRKSNSVKFSTYSKYKYTDWVLDTPPGKLPNVHDQSIDKSEHPSVSESISRIIDQLREQNNILKERVKKKEEGAISKLRRELEIEREKGRSLQPKLLVGQKKIEDLNKEQESLIDIFSEERDRRDEEVRNLKKKLKEASKRIQELATKARQLENEPAR